MNQPPLPEPHPGAAFPERPAAEAAPAPSGAAAAPAAEGVREAVPEAKPGTRRRLILGALLLLLAAGAGYFYYAARQEAPLPASPAATVAEPLSQGEFRLSDHEMRALRIEPMQLHEFRAERLAEGRIAYNEDRSTPVFSPYNGRVMRAQARLGDTVAAGDTLFEIETTDLAGAANDLLSAADAANKARATLDQARREEARQQSLFSARAASQRDVEQARVAAMTAASDLRSAEATLAAARDKLRVLGRSAEQVARIEATRMVQAQVPVTAPIGGTVVQRRVGPGQWLATGAGDPVYTIADLSTMWLVAAVREMDAPMIRTGQPVEVTVGALPGRTFDARITMVGAGLDPSSRRLTVRAEVQDPDHLLKPEMFATFRIAVGAGEQNVGVPVNAVIYRGAEASVWVALDGNRFILRRIRPGIRAGDMLEVTEGLKPGEKVVTGGALFIDRAARID
ncbi:efflux RND transporter periplasmic adaptor subunit [Siccirubricoccus phaeus]|uniref:efflux RND transporter periplasmic adaptor subunit n=1 Tax=Siccirubricoccus phaeus TaxID=2595053 RepID=UPI0011F20D5F|nr:efflux RND transporter periplasmic adaptor subunit [Siccirubricoccus phaeus]